MRLVCPDCEEETEFYQRRTDMAGSRARYSVREYVYRCMKCGTEYEERPPKSERDKANKSTKGGG